MNLERFLIQRNSTNGFIVCDQVSDRVHGHKRLATPGIELGEWIGEIVIVKTMSKFCTWAIFHYRTSLFLLQHRLNSIEYGKYCRCIYISFVMYITV